MPGTVSTAAMVGVDSAVISPDELAGRISALLASSPSPSKGRLVGRAPARSSASPASIADLHTIGMQIRPPVVTRLPGARGHATWLVKRVIRKLSSWYVEPRWAAQQAWDARVIEELDLLGRQGLALRLQVLAFFEQVGELRALLEHSLPSGVEFRRHVDAAVDEGRRAAASQAEVDGLRTEVRGVLQRLGAASSSGADIDYAAFEDRFRGSPEELIEEQRRYLEALPPTDAPGRVVDLGCGRGEMLELLVAGGYDAVGVDPDPTMVEVCRGKGLDVIADDGIRFLERVEPGSLKAVFCAQVVEHLLTSELERLVRLAHDRLRPGGVLIMETINPLSLHALGHHFYADTSHIRPVHPETLRFICEQVGFSPVEMRELSPHPMTSHIDELPDDPSGNVLRELIGSVFGYQDYAVFATK